MSPPNGNAGAPGTEHSTITILEGMQLRREPPPPDRFSFDKLIETNILFLGGIGTGKTNAMKHLVRQFRDKNGPDDLFVFFDSKGDFLRNFYRPGDAVISTAGAAERGGVVWNVFRDLSDDPRQRAQEAFEIASTIFSDDLESAAQNMFFASAARDVFAGVMELMATPPRPSRRCPARAPPRKRRRSVASRRRASRSSTRPRPGQRTAVPARRAATPA